MKPDREKLKVEMQTKAELTTLEHEKIGLSGDVYPPHRCKFSLQR
jgi:hypothetical protein